MHSLVLISAGAVSISGGASLLSHNKFWNNSAAGHGGAVAYEDDCFTVYDTSGQLFPWPDLLQKSCFAPCAAICQKTAVSSVESHSALSALHHQVSAQCEGTMCRAFASASSGLGFGHVDFTDLHHTYQSGRTVCWWQWHAD